MSRWRILEMISNIVVLTSVLFVYIATKPNRNWIFNCQNENEEKNRQFVRKFSFIGLILAVCWLLMILLWWEE